MIGCVDRGSNESQACILRIGDDIKAARDAGRINVVELRVLLEDTDVCDDRLFCLINGQRFEFSAFEQLSAPMPTENIQGSLDADFRVLRYPPVAQGDNRICFLLDGIDAPDPWPTWLRCEVAVRYL